MSASPSFGATVFLLHDRLAVRVWVGGGEFKDRVLWVDWRVWRVAFGAVLGCMQVGEFIGGMCGTGVGMSKWWAAVRYGDNLMWI